MTMDTQEGTQVPVRRVDLLQDKWHREGRYRRDLSPEARRALSGWSGVEDHHVQLLATAVREVNTVERVLRGAMRGFHKGGVCWQAVDLLRDGPMNTRRIAWRLEISIESARKTMDRLEVRGIVRSLGPDQDPDIVGQRPVLWELNPDLGGDEA